MAVRQLRVTKTPSPPKAAERSPRVQTIVHGDLQWIDIRQPTPTEMTDLRRSFPFHPLTLDDCLSKVQRPKLDDYSEEGYIFMVLHFPTFNKQNRHTNPVEVDVFVGRGYVVTVHEGVLKPLVQTFATAQNDETVRTLVQELSFVRRDIITLRRIIKPNLPVLRQLESRERAFLNLDEDTYFGSILDHLGKQWDMLEDDKEIIEGLNDTLDSLTSHRINEVMKILTVISVVLLPMTLVASIYGMNIQLPFDQHPFAFVIVMGWMLLAALGMMSYFRYKGWI
jgi:magnesium transporter